MINKLHYKSRDEWFAIRQKLTNESYIGASTVAAAINENKWKSAVRLFYEMLNLVPENKNTLLTLNGLAAEPHIKRLYESYSTDQAEHIYNYENGIITKPTEDVDYILTNDKYPNIFASLDFKAINGEFSHPVDSKLVSYNYFKKWPELWNATTKKFDKDSCMPFSYSIQLQCQAMLMEVD